MQSDSNEESLKDPWEIKLANCSLNIIILTEKLILFYETFKFYGH